jgi:hypothetical protein
VSSGQFSAAPPNADNTASALPPAQPVSSNGEVVGTPTTGRIPGVLFRGTGQFGQRSSETNNSVLNNPQQGARDF